MDIQLQTILLSGGIALASSIITACISNNFTKKQIETSHKNALIELFADKKSRLYTECYGEIAKLLNRTFLVFDGKYVERLESFESEIVIQGSADVVTAYKEILAFVAKIYTEAFDYNEYIDEQMHSQNDYDKQNGEGEPDERVIFKIDCAIGDYQDKHAPDKKEVEKYIDNLVKAMKADLGIE